MITRLHLKQTRKVWFIWASTVSICILGFMAIYPSMANNSMSQLAQSMMQDLPDSIMAIIGFDTIPDFSNILIFYGYIMQYMNIAIAIYCLTLGLDSFLSEEKNGTIEFLYSQPISRKDLILGKLKANLMNLLALWTVMLISSILSLSIFKGSNVDLLNILKELTPVLLGILGVSLCFLLIGSGLSLLLPSNISTAGTAMAIVFMTYVLGIVSELLKSLNFLGYLSPLGLVNPNSIINNGMNLFALLTWFIISVSLFIYGLYVFQKRDIQL